MFSEDTEHQKTEEKLQSEPVMTIEAYVSGHVQGVGFRACVRKIALGLCISGEVMNLSDGNVYIIATGESAVLEKMISSLYECPGAYVREIEIFELEPRNFTDFSIIRLM
ncbi:acylphosphatase [Methanomicrobium antiquum]|uniref:acylphosphatase n=1 Tax=Methanomicrobium antiquum TaxID=487686 RepID=A0AAF0FTJ3_9EURY|nr:acylphosphatase [Methanomicrobium antiquum]WFN36278.1 acylphosphatase [Methanomicrobium antiquum]